MSEDPQLPTEALEESRQAIDSIDLELVGLLNRRARHACRIGQLKRRTGDPIYQPQREEEIFRQVLEANTGPLGDDAVRRLFERILDEARRLERSS